MQDDKKKDGKDSDSKPTVTGLSWTQAVGAAKTLQPIPGSESNLPRYAGAFAAGIVVGILVMWGYGTTNKPRTVAGPNATTANTSQIAGVALTQEGGAQASFEVPSPQEAGKKILITRAIVNKPTWVVVYESQNGKPGRALGASLFTAKKSSGAVTLLRSTTVGKTYLVGQATDNGNGTFSLTTDKPVLLGDNRLLISISVQ